MSQKHRKPFRIIARWPLASFLVLLALLLLLIVIGNKMRAPETDSQEDVALAQKEVHVMRMEDTPYIEASGEVSKGGAVTITATTSGIVNRIHAQTGAAVSTGSRLVTLAETYDGGNTAATTHQITARHAQYQDETFDKNIGIADDLRDDVGGDSLDASIARKQQTLQKRNLEFQQDIAHLEQQQSAQSAARFYPSAPLTGTIERIFITPGQTITAGEKLMVLRGTSDSTKIVVTLGAEMARAIDVTKPSQLTLSDGSVIDALPAHISSSPTDARAFSVTFIIDEELAQLSDGDFVSVALPIENGADHLRVPLDAVQILRDGAIVFVVEDGVARARTVTLGSVLGAHVTVLSGIDSSDSVITDRTVFDGDPVTIVE